MFNLSGKAKLQRGASLVFAAVFALTSVLFAVVNLGGVKAFAADKQKGASIKLDQSVSAVEDEVNCYEVDLKITPDKAKKKNSTSYTKSAIIMNIGENFIFKENSLTINSQLASADSYSYNENNNTLKIELATFTDAQTVTFELTVNEDKLSSLEENTNYTLFEESEFTTKLNDEKRIKLDIEAYTSATVTIPAAETEITQPAEEKAAEKQAKQEEKAEEKQAKQEEKAAEKMTKATEAKEEEKAAEMETKKPLKPSDEDQKEKATKEKVTKAKDTESETKATIAPEKEKEKAEEEANEATKATRPAKEEEKAEEMVTKATLTPSEDSGFTLPTAENSDTKATTETTSDIAADETDVTKEANSTTAAEVSGELVTDEEVAAEEVIVSQNDLVENVAANEDVVAAASTDEITKTADADEIAIRLFACLLVLSALALMSMYCYKAFRINQNKK